MHNKNSNRIVVLHVNRLVGNDCVATADELGAASGLRVRSSEAVCKLLLGTLHGLVVLFLLVREVLPLGLV